MWCYIKTNEKEIIIENKQCVYTCSESPLSLYAVTLLLLLFTANASAELLAELAAAAAAAAANAIDGKYEPAFDASSASKSDDGAFGPGLSKSIP